ncbi:tRNA pseudouridine(38-40) synthase TruA [Thiohalobacter sp. IOR34]|uniref:tRNA pseudouridine(38-40) synthase TruA n=1 Tax=Thiohalobacter sp. IOR34 TaxID=3057176 RepID=UPI0025B1A22E|nr:tRNA pseudouridine(38-40) synthase TruA [Thiohalobacter sp. IOR34]WJW74514.1 tRNA pseudouridine(38-40) synthase TruA [Thiohalobacter sp. IOR34]
MRIALGIEYDGSGYCGWQRQKHAPSVQEVVEQALSRVADHPVEVTCAGRTDTGVHATAQVAHFDTEAVRELHSWLLGGNSNLPPAVSITWVKAVAADFHARFSARGRQYRYVILNRLARPALLHQRVCWEHRPLDVAAMQAAARALLGEHDFSAFRAVGCQARHAVRTLHRLELARSGDFIYLDIEANAFLHHMVRNIAGTLMAVGRGDRPVDWVAEVLAGRDRTLGGVTAPAAGLYFVHVHYPEDYGLALAPRLPLFG